MITIISFVDSSVGHYKIEIFYKDGHLYFFQTGWVFDFCYMDNVGVGILTEEMI